MNAKRFTRSAATPDYTIDNPGPRPFGADRGKPCPPDQHLWRVIRKVIGQTWDGNWGAVEPALLNHTRRPLEELTLFDIRMIFDVRQSAMTVELRGVPDTPTDTMQHVDFGPPAAGDYDWTVGQIASRFERVDGLISQLCNSGAIKSTGEGRDRRVSLISAELYFSAQAKKKLAQKNAAAARDRQQEAREYMATSRRNGLEDV